MSDDYAYHLVEEVRAGRMSRRELMRRASVYGLSFGAISTLVAACGGSGSTSGQTGTSGQPTTGPFRRGGTAKLGAITPASDLEPITMNDGGTVLTVQTSCEYLCFPRADLVLEPKLATRWRPGSTPKQWTFTIRDGVLWHDGSRLTADDVVASFKTYTDPKGTATALSSFNGILTKSGVEKVDDRTVRFHLERPYADFPYLVSALNYATPILPKDYQPGDFRKGGVGTGAYILKRYQTKRSANYVRNDKYWAKTKPHLDGIDVQYYAEADSMVLAMQGGGIDLLPGLAYADARALKGSSDIRLLSNPSSSYRPVHMRVDKAPFTDRRVRQAIALALDRPAIVQALLSDSGQVGNDHAFAPIFPTSPSTAQVPQRKRNLQKARQLLAQAGHGGGLKLQLTTLQYEDIPRFAVILKDQLRHAGVDLSLSILPQEAYFGSGSNQPWLEVPMGIVYWASRGSPSQLIEPAYLSDGVWNSAHWKNERFDKLMADFDAQTDEGKRKKLAAQAAGLMQEETPALIAYWIKELRAVRNGLQGVARGPNVVFDSSTIGFAAGSS